MHAEEDRAGSGTDVRQSHDRRKRQRQQARRRPPPSKPDSADDNGDYGRADGGEGAEAELHDGARVNAVIAVVGHGHAVVDSYRETEPEDDRWDDGSAAHAPKESVNSKRTHREPA